ncbi:ABC transporter permease [Brumicola nitratireducens]|uniref:Putative ABC transport system permease protein n=1 Tax=Glaciecola nitratireducens (strain JCM 12485 / KCTC 12276 / FR1064) TaxID=1085623 RepID=G4QJH3_GLANF|nr:ABC transporter permease [Glaciecola nitratireducens]AEP28579.1 putative ABC transport system permease protein [Glaciecola nitratireducens FR1064]
MIFRVAKQSLLHRKVSVMLTFLALLVSVSLLLSIEHIRKEAKSSFYRTVSGVDLIVGARTGQINLLLSSVFRVGANANSVSWESYQSIVANPQVEWSIPLSLGDSHKGFAVIGTTNAYFEHYRYGDKRQLSFQAGGRFASSGESDSSIDSAGDSENGAAKMSAVSQHFDVVLGADAAKQLNYKVGDEIIISHGVGKVSFSYHDDHPFTIVGILQFTGTPVDQGVHVGLNAIESIHTQGNPSLSKSTMSRASLKKPQEAEHAEHEHEHSDKAAPQPAHTPLETSNKQDSNKHALAQPTQVSAFMLGLKSRIAVLQMQRQVNQSKLEPLSAIIPGVALGELWRLVGAVENVLRIISAAVLVASLLGLSTMLLASLRERRAEISVFRVMGAKPSFVFWLLQLEALSIALGASVFAVLLVTGVILLSNDWLLAEYGLSLSANILSVHTLSMIGVVLIATFVIALIPSIGAYRKARSLN